MIVSGDFPDVPENQEDEKKKKKYLKKKIKKEIDLNDIVLKKGDIIYIKFEEYFKI